MKNVICVGSGKGGVGKSSVTANLAAALAAQGKTVGVLDADVWGYSQPRMLGLGGQRPKVSGERKLIPLTAHDGLKVMSIGFFVEQDAAVVWRGPMLHKALQQFLEDVDWGELDYLLIDLPPGTGDVSMTLVPAAPAGEVPDRHHAAGRGPEGGPPLSADMAGKLKLEIAGVIENMTALRHPGRRALPDLRRGRRPAAGRGARGAAAGQGAADDAPARAGRRGHPARVRRSGRSGRAGDLPGGARADRADAGGAAGDGRGRPRRALAVEQVKPAGMSLPMA